MMALVYVKLVMDVLVRTAVPPVVGTVLFIAGSAFGWSSVRRTGENRIVAALFLILNLIALLLACWFWWWAITS